MIITIKKTGINGEGIGYLNKIPVFVEGGLVGETVDVDIIENNKNYKKGSIKNILKASEERIIPNCAHYPSCNGCSLLHTTYFNQLEIKKEILKEALYKYSDLDIDADIEESIMQFGYRNCLKLPFIYNHGKISLGIYKQDSNYICPIDSCLIHDDLLEILKNKVLEILNNSNLGIYNHKARSGLRYLVLRQIGNRAHMCLITGENKISCDVVNKLSNIKEIVSIYQCINVSKTSVNIFSNKMIHLAGGKHLTFKIDNIKFNLSIKSFYQLNSNQAKKLYRYVVDLLNNDEDLIVEAYSGIGAMSLLAHNKAKQIVGIEYVNDAVVNANVNAFMNHIDNVKFLCGDAAEMLNKEFNRKHINTLIVDPPRSGLDDKMIDAILSMKIDKIIYVSCNPATLAKNLNDLSNKYAIESIKAFDMFPQTSHVETVVKLISIKNYGY